MDPIPFQPRTYRTSIEGDRFKTFRVVVETSDLYVKGLADLQTETDALIRQARSHIEQAIARRIEFLKSLEPVEAHPDDAPVVLWMIRAGTRAGTGPMAAVAGAVAQFVGRGLLELTPELIIENGGDIFIMVASPAVIGIHAGKSPLSGRLGLVVQPTPVPVGVCTSSATVGPSLSLGRADAATVIAKDVALADAVATALGNRVKHPRDVKSAVEWALSVEGIEGAVAICDEMIAAMGDVELVPITPLP